MTDKKENDDGFSLNIETSKKKSGQGAFATLKKKLSMKSLVIIGSLLSFLIGGSILFFVLSGDRATKELETKDAGTMDDMVQETIIDDTPELSFGDIVKIEIIDIKLGDIGGEKDFKVGIAFKIDQQELRDELVRKDSEIKNKIETLLKSKTYGELEGTDGKILLRNEIVQQLNEILETGHIVNLYFYKYLII